MRAFIHSFKCYKSLTSFIKFKEALGEDTKEAGAICRWYRNT